MELHVEAGHLPERGTLVVLVGHDGAMSRAAAELDRATDGLLGRALRARQGELRHGRAIDLFLPAGVALERA